MVPEGQACSAQVAFKYSKFYYPKYNLSATCFLSDGAWECLRTAQPKTLDSTPHCPGV